MTMTLDDFYAQMLNVAPPGEAALVEGPVMPQSPYLPPWQSDAMGLPFPTSLMGGGMPAGEVPASAEPDPMLGLTPSFGAEPTASAQYGYAPQPRPALPTGIQEGPDALYGPFRQVWEGLQQEPDPLLAMLAGKQQAPPPPQQVPAQQPMMSPTTTPQPWGPQPQDSFIAQPGDGGERVLHGRGYGRVLDRVNWLRGLRAAKGF